jgi:hypothetical protein
MISRKVWFSQERDAKSLLAAIKACPELVIIHGGNARVPASLRSVMDELTSLRLFLADGKTLVLVQRQGRGITARVATYRKRLQRRASSAPLSPA